MLYCDASSQPPTVRWPFRHPTAADFAFIFGAPYWAEPWPAHPVTRRQATRSHPRPRALLRPQQAVRRRVPSHCWQQSRRSSRLIPPQIPRPHTRHDRPLQWHARFTLGVLSMVWSACTARHAPLGMLRSVCQVAGEAQKLVSVAADSLPEWCCRRLAPLLLYTGSLLSAP